jgi:hypothetical protein
LLYHSDLRSYQCLACKKTFKTVGDLGTHMNTHKDL